MRTIQLTCASVCLAICLLPTSASDKPSDISAESAALFRDRRNVACLSESDGRLKFRGRPSRLVPEKAVANPIRKVNGRWVNLAPMMQRYSGGGSSEVVEGVIEQVIDEQRVLLNQNRQTISLDGIRTEGLHDGVRLEILAFPSGTYQFTTVLGATRTVPAYTYGQLPTANEWKAILAAFRAAESTLSADRKSAENARRSKLDSDEEAENAAIIAHLRERIDKGSVDAARELAERYDSGRGVQKDPKRAAELRKLADERESKGKGSDSANR